MARPYAINYEPLIGTLEKLDVQQIFDANTEPWFNQTLCQVGDVLVRVGVFEGEYHWHKHDEDDEFFYVVEGKLLIDLEDRIVDLTRGQGLVVPKGTVHRTRAPQRTIILMVENAGIIPTGN